MQKVYGNNTFENIARMLSCLHVRLRKHVHRACCRGREYAGMQGRMCDDVCLCIGVFSFCDGLTRI